MLNSKSASILQYLFYCRIFVWRVWCRQFPAIPNSSNVLFSSIVNDHAQHSDCLTDVYAVSKYSVQKIPLPTWICSFDRKQCFFCFSKKFTFVLLHGWNHIEHNIFFSFATFIHLEQRKSILLVKKERYVSNYWVTKLRHQRRICFGVSVSWLNNWKRIFLF